MAVRFMNPKVTKTHKEHLIFKYMLPLVDMRKLIQEEDSVNK